MLIITLQREKCIGCNYCAEFDAEHFSPLLVFSDSVTDNE